MQLVNWSGALIGPGSEWFWAMLQFVVVAATLIGLYRQLRLQSSQQAIEQLGAFDREWRDELNSRVCLEILLSLRDGVDPAHIPDGLAISIGAFWEKIGGLVRAGHIDPGTALERQWWRLRCVVDDARASDAKAASRSRGSYVPRELRVARWDHE